jgi:hypothetical protein
MAQSWLKIWREWQGVMARQWHMKTSPEIETLAYWMTAILSGSFENVMACINRTLSRCMV